VVTRTVGALVGSIPDHTVLEDGRCFSCGRLLMKWDTQRPLHVEIKCPRCQLMNCWNIKERRPIGTNAL
jgi:phage FluMu protein Com